MAKTNNKKTKTLNKKTNSKLSAKTLIKEKTVKTQKLAQKQETPIVARPPKKKGDSTTQNKAVAALTVTEMRSETKIEATISQTSPVVHKELTEEEILKIQEKISNEIKKFLSIGKSKGFLTFEEINDLLPAEVMSSELLDVLMLALDENNIKLVDGTKKGKNAKGEEFLSESTETSESEADEEDEDEDEDKEEEVSKGNDPVRLYLRKMGSVSLLTREGEVEIAKKIEEGELEILKVLDIN
jgi:RNA polymerase primary sigma factor